MSVPGSSAGTVIRPPTGGRISTAQRLNTGQRQQLNLQTVGQKTEMKVPTTAINKEGLRSMPSSSGPGRQISDLSFFEQKLVKKNKEIADEIQRIREENEKIEKNNEAYSQCQSEYEKLMRDVRDLEGTLADYNLASDKARNHTPVTDLIAYTKMLSDKNKQVEQEADNIFTQRKEVESQIAQMEGQVDKITQNLEDQLTKLDPSAHGKYVSLQNERKKLIEMGQDRQGQLNQLNQQIYELDRQIKTDTYLTQYLEIEKDFKKLEVEKLQVDEDLKIYSMEDLDAKQYLTERAKELKARSQQLDDTIDSITAETEKIRADLNRSKNNPIENDLEKLETLKAREDEMNQFISNFGNIKKTEIEEQHRLQETIVALLAHISNNITCTEHLPDQNAFRELSDDLDFKQQQVTNAERTRDGLQKQLDKYHKDFAKMQDLDVRIAGEVNTIKQKIETMKKEIAIFDDIPGLKKSAVETRDYLTKLKALYETRSYHLKEMTERLIRENNSVKGQLKEIKVDTDLQNILKKIRDREQSVFHMTEGIERTSRSTNYIDLKKQCMESVLQINQETINIQLGV